ncbi:hypothetical protein QR98_0015510 [Sarcoptes scabiei]|uniref:Phosphatidylinositol-glycan biosynthesis class W protein-like protein n=1 Tax=Sarcoptes scabiei TaxID=52283 RepID=A0A131ZWT2_SARSC|nr:hypothetical protein QR98_0015510 [Sarcoptes scabiei]
MEKEIKIHKENFVKGNQGSSSPLETFELIVMMQLSHIFFELSLLNLSRIRLNKLFRTVIDFIANYLPFILATTFLSDYVGILISLMSIAIIINAIIVYLNRTTAISFNDSRLSEIDRFGSDRIPYVSNLLSTLLIATTFSILAVDFSIFPRRFSKTEIKGWSLMDFGVGGFIAINGGLAPESRKNRNCFRENFFKTFRSSFLFFSLGMIRLLSIKLLNYQEIISEYGIHWNFFFTLCFVKQTFVIYLYETA